MDPDDLAPGSLRAIARNCWCSITDNNRGTVMPEGGWKISPRCPIHGDDPFKDVDPPTPVG